MIDLLTRVSNFFTTKKIRLPHEWIEACVHWLQEEHSNEPQNVNNANWVCQKAYEQWLFADLAELSHGFLPNYVDDQTRILEEDLVLQINSIQDVGMPSYAQLQQLRKDDIQNSLIDTDKVKPQMWEPKPNRMLLITLTDGVTTVLGMEYTALLCLSLQTQPGTKVMVKRGCQMRRSVLLLTNAAVAVLGGAVDTLLVTNAVENVVRRQLGLEEVETPAMYEEPAATPSVASSQASQYCPATQSQQPGNLGNGARSNQNNGGLGRQNNGGLTSGVCHGAGNQLNGPVRPRSVAPLNNGKLVSSESNTAFTNLEDELDDDFDLDIEAAMLEAEYVQSSAQGSTGSKEGTRNNTLKSSSKLQKTATNSSCSSVKNVGLSKSGSSLQPKSWDSSIQTGSTATSINLENKPPNPSRPRPKLSYNPFLEPRPSNRPPEATSKCEVDFDDGFSEQDLSALEEELQFVESQVSHNDVHENFSGNQSTSRISPIANRNELSGSLMSKDSHTAAGSREASKTCRVSVAPQRNTLFKSLESGSGFNKKDSTRIIKSNSPSSTSASAKLIENDDRTSIKRPPDLLSNVPDESPSNKLRKINSVNNSTLPSHNDSKSRLQDKLKNESPKFFNTKNSTVKNLAVVYPQENETLESKDGLSLEKTPQAQEKRSLSETAELGHPITYLIFVPQCPVAEQEFVVKGFVMTLLSRLEHRRGEWELAVCINDGSAGLDVDVHDQVLQRLIGLSVPEMRELKIKAISDSSLRATLSEKVTQCREKLISLCSLLTVRVSPELQRPLLVDIAPFTQSHAKLLQLRCQHSVL